MDGIGLLLRLAWKRLRSEWRLQASLLLGSTLAVAVMASATISLDAVGNIGLRHALAQRPASDVNIQVEVPVGAPTEAAYQTVAARIESLIAINIAQVVKARATLARSDTMAFEGLPRGLGLGTGRPRGSLLALDDFPQHVRFIEGRLFQAGAAEPEVVIEGAAARLYQLRVGQRLELFPIIQEKEPRVSARIVGVYEPLDPQEPFWLDRQDLRFTPYQSWDFLPLFGTREDFFRALSATYPAFRVEHIWLLYMDHSAIQADNARAVSLAVGGFKGALRAEVPGSYVKTELDRILNSFSQRLVITRVPLFLFVSLIVVTTMYYLALVASLLVQRQSAEIALWKSRGASARLVLGVYALQGFYLAAAAVALGPLLALAVTSLLGRLGPFSLLSGGGLLAVRLTGSTYALAGAGALLGFLAMVVPATGAARQSLVTARLAEGRPPGQPFFQRYFLDLPVVAAGAVLYWQLQARGSFFGRSLEGQSVGSDTLLLLLPTLMLLGGALLFLRLFPAAVASLEWAAQRALPVAVVFGLRHLARHPLPYASLVILLVLATSLGVFTASFAATLDRSGREQVLYQVGADLRVEGARPAAKATAAPLKQQLEALPGVALAAAAYRRSGSIMSARFGGSYTMLAFDPASFPAVAWYRRDFGQGPLEKLLRPLAGPADGASAGVPLPPDTQALAIWARPHVPRPELSLQARLVDANGHYFSYSLGPLDFQGWKELQARLEEPVLPSAATRRLLPALGRPQPPLNLVALYLLRTRGTAAADPGALFLDDLRALADAGGTSVLLEDFEELAPWGPLGDALQPGIDSLERSEAVVHSGKASGLFTWGRGFALGLRGLQAGGSESDTALPVLASKGFLEESGFKVGEEPVVSSSAIPLKVRIVGSLSHFPTLDPKDGPFLIASAPELLQHINLRTPGAEQLADEVWLRAGEPARASASLQEAIQGGILNGRVLDALAQQRAAHADPLIAAAWGGILLIAFVGVLFASAAGFLVHAYLSTDQRRTELALLRTLGFSRGQVSLLVWLSYGVTLGLGLGIGTILGNRLGVLVLRFLEVTEAGEPLAPPFAIATNWTALSVIYGALALVFGATFLMVAWLLGRMALHRLLRIGEA